MDFIELIKSRDVKKYLREIDYKLNILQCAFLVWHQKCNWSIFKKMRAYYYLIKNYEDMPIDTTDYFNGMAKHYDSFKEVLKETIKRVFEEVNEFRDSKDGKYCYYTYYDSVGFEFDTYDEAIEFFIDNPQSANQINGYYYLARYKKEDESERQNIALNNEYQIIKTKETAYEEQSRTLYNIFNYMNVSIPTPFKRGDILQNPYHNTYMHKFNTYYCIDTINTWGTKEARNNGILDPNYRFDRNLKFRLEHGRYDVMMNFDGYAICSYEDRDLDGKKNGVIKKKLIHDFDEWPLLIDLEYADKNELVGSEKLILLVSEYIKTDDKYHKRMDIESILYYYDMIMYEDKHNVRCKSFHEAWNYIDLTMLSK